MAKHGIGYFNVNIEISKTAQDKEDVLQIYLYYL